MPRFLYLNIYSFLIIIAGILALVLPFYRISVWLLALQVIIAINLFIVAGRLFATWDDKKKKIHILKSKNINEFRPDTFDVFMQAPCGRLLARYVLAELGKSNEYKKLLKMKKPFFETVSENCSPVKSVVYINEETNLS